MTLSNSEEGLLEMDQKTGFMLELSMFLKEFLSRNQYDRRDEYGQKSKCFVSFSSREQEKEKQRHRKTKFQTGLRKVYRQHFICVFLLDYQIFF